MSGGALHLMVRLEQSRYETVLISRDAVLEVRDPPRGEAGVDGLSHALVVTRGNNYVVSGGVGDVARSI